jgi:hypothetical protein
VLNITLLVHVGGNAESFICRGHGILVLCLVYKFCPSPSHVYCIFAQLTNSNVLGKLPIRDSNNREVGNCYWWIWQKYNAHVTVNL